MILYLTHRLPQRWLVLATALMLIQTTPHILALRDENIPEHSTRLKAAAWIEQHVSSDERICARLVPYDTAPFDFTQYPPDTEGCRYIIRVERERPIPPLEAAALKARFEPRFNSFPIPLVTTHSNPQISIYENLATH